MALAWSGTVGKNQPETTCYNQTIGRQCGGPLAPTNNTQSYGLKNLKLFDASTSVVDGVYTNKTGGTKWIMPGFLLDSGWNCFGNPSQVANNSDYSINSISLNEILNRASTSMNVAELFLSASSATGSNGCLSSISDWEVLYNAPSADFNILFKTQLDYATNATNTVYNNFMSESLDTIIQMILIGAVYFVSLWIGFKVFNR